MQHEAPIDPTTLTRWRSRLGAEKLELLLKQTLEIARERKLLKRRDLAEVNVDTSVQPKAIAFPTDSRLYFKMSRALVRQAVKGGIQIRQSYRWVAKVLLVPRPATPMPSNTGGRGDRSCCCVGSSAGCCAISAGR